MLKPALDVLSGQVLYRESFEWYGALTTFLQAGSLLVFGKSLLSLRILNVLLYGVSGGFLFAIWRRFLPPALTWLSFGLWLCLAPFYQSNWYMLPWSSVVALAFQTASIYCLLNAVEAKAPERSALLGAVLAVCTLLSRMPVGLTLIAAEVMACAIVALRRGRSRSSVSLLGGYLGGLVCAAGVVGLVLGMTGATDEWWLQTFVWPRRWAMGAKTSWGSILANLFPFNSAALRPNPPVGVVRSLLSIASFAAVLFSAAFVPVRSRVWRLVMTGFLLLVLAYVLDFATVRTVIGVALLAPATALVLLFAYARDWKNRSRFSTTDEALVILLFAGLASWSQFHPMACPRHVFWGVAPLVGVLIYAVYRFAGAVTPVLVSVSLAFSVLALGRITDVRENLSRPLVAIDAVPVLRGIRVTPNFNRELARIYGAVQSYTATKPNGVALLIFGPDALWGTFATDLRNPDPYYVDWPQVPYTPARDAARKRFIQERRPLVMLQGEQMKRKSDLTDYELLTDVPVAEGIILRPR
jgi:hypothetical protein